MSASVDRIDWLMAARMDLNFVVGSLEIAFELDQIRRCDGWFIGEFPRGSCSRLVTDFALFASFSLKGIACFTVSKGQMCFCLLCKTD